MEIHKHLVRCAVYNDLFLHRKGIFPFKIIFGYDIIAWNGNNKTIYFWNSHFLFLMMWQPTEVHFKTCDVWEFLLLAERSIIFVWKHNLNKTIYFQTAHIKNNQRLHQLRECIFEVLLLSRLLNQIELIIMWYE